jgi:hypothetical protein
MDKVHTVPAMAIALVLGFSTAAQADIALRFTDADRASGSTLMIKGDKVRMEEHEADGSTVYSLFDGDTRTLTMVIDEERSYAQLTEEGLRAQAQHVRQMQEEFLAQMRQQMAHMPPDQRQMMEQQMRQMGIDPALLSGQDAPTPDLASLKTRPTGETRTIGGVRCEGMDVMLEGQRTNELCVARPGAVGMSDADFRTLRSLFAFMHSLSEIAVSMGGPFAGDMGTEMLPDVDGVPVMVRNLEDGSTITLESVSTDPLPAELFTIPAGYQRVDPF